jgi:hypothetical protein
VSSTELPATAVPSSSNAPQRAVHQPPAPADAQMRQTSRQQLLSTMPLRHVNAHRILTMIDQWQELKKQENDGKKIERTKQIFCSFRSESNNSSDFGCFLPSADE